MVVVATDSNISVPGPNLIIKFPSGKLIGLTVARTDTIADVKVQIQEREMVPVLSQRLYFGSVELGGGTLADYSIHDSAKLFLLFTCR
jgi:hypothetical protein